MGAFLCCLHNLGRFNTATVILFIIFIDNYVFNAAIKNLTKVIKSDGTYGLIVFKPVKQAAADAVGVDKFISCNILFFHCFIQWFKGYHCCSPCQCIYIIIINALYVDNCL